MGIIASLIRKLKPARSPADLAKWLARPEADLRAWLKPEPDGFTVHYQRFTIPKRSGGQRLIEAPAEKLKELQHCLLHRLLAPLPLHPAATGFARGRSIVHNARPHVGQGLVINIDLQDFFPSITPAQVEKAFRGLGWNAEAAQILTQICTTADHLPQGAPTSPALSNLVCRRLDTRLAALAKRCHGHYTRYADDLTFSFPALGRNKRLRPTQKRTRRAQPKAPSRRILTLIRQIIAAEGFKIQLKKKVRLQRRHQRQTATGLVVNQQVNLPRATRRLMRAMRHRQKLGYLPPPDQRRLRGLEALAHMVEKQRGA